MSKYETSIKDQELSLKWKLWSIVN
jgi:hypothetical protein